MTMFVLQILAAGLIVLTLFGCAGPIQLYNGEKRDPSDVALIRSGPKALLVTIDGIEVNEKYIDKTDWRKAASSAGRWYELLPGRHFINVDYAGFYRHTNPSHAYVIYSPEKILKTHLRGPFIKQDGESFELIPMQSDSSHTIEINLEAEHRYEIRVELAHNPMRPDQKPRLPDLIAPADKRYFIVDFIDFDDETLEPLILPVPRADRFVISDFPWRAYVIDIDESPEEPSPLAKAIETGSSDFVEFVLATEETDVIDEGNDWGMTALHLAAEKGNLDIVRILIDHGAKIDAENDMGATPLFYAAGNGHDRVVRELIEARADVRDRQKTRWTALHYAAQGGHGDVVGLLLQHGADIDCRTDIGLTPLHIAVNENYTDIVRQLIDHGADVNLPDKEKWYPLHYAALNGTADIAAMLLASGARTDVVSKTGCTPLHNAALSGNVETGRLLIEKGADVNASLPNGWTPLDLAEQKNHLFFVDLLAKHGAVRGRR